MYTIEDLNEFVYDNGVVRKYQYLLCTGQIPSICIKDQTYKFYAISFKQTMNHIVLKHISKCIYKLLISKGVSTGYKLHDNIESIPDITKPPQSMLVPNTPPVICAGHPNFAHFFWNQAPGVVRLSRVCNLKLVQSEATKNVVDLYKLKNITPVSHEESKNHPTMGIGSVKIPYYTHRQLYHQHGITRPTTVSNRKQIALGIRGNRHRAMLNEYEYYDKLLCSITNLNINVKILLDGFTPVTRNIKESRERNVCKISEICTKLLDNHSALDIVNLDGIIFEKWIKEINSIDYYVTHVGTMQHKYNWLFTNIPGQLIGPTDSQFAKWSNSMSYNTTKVDSLEVEYTIIENESTQPPLKDNYRNKPYKINNIEQAVDITIKNILKYI